MKRYIISFIIILFGLYLIVGSVKDIFRLLKTEQQLDKAEEKLGQLRQENQELLAKKQYWSTDEFIKQEAKTKLNLSRQGESLVTPTPQIEPVLSLAGIPQEPNWKKWLELFWY